MAIVDKDGNEVASYAYNAYGEIISQSGAMADVNPLRYRGYYYDAETGLYYLQSRYYDAGTGRFINADDYASTGQGFTGNNMFAYCENNPTIKVDNMGNIGVLAVLTITVGLVGFVAGAASAMVSNAIAGAKLMDGVLASGLGGATYGVVAIYAGPAAAGYASAFVESTVEEIGQYQNGSKELTAENLSQSAGEVLVDTAINGTIYAVAGKAAGNVSSLNIIALSARSVLKKDMALIVEESVVQALVYLFGKGAYYSLIS